MHSRCAVAGSAVLIAFGAELLVDLLGAHHPAVAPVPVAAPVPTSACGEPACGMSTGAGTPRLLDLSDPPGKLRAGVHFALEQVRELGLWMLRGVLLGAAVETFIPEDMFTHYLGGSSVLGLVAALAVAGLFSADSLGMLPWGQSLLVKGLGAGRAMILLIASVSTNVSTRRASAHRKRRPSMRHVRHDLDFMDQATTVRMELRRWFVWAQATSRRRSVSASGSVSIAMCPVGNSR